MRHQINVGTWSVLNTVLVWFLYAAMGFHTVSREIHDMPYGYLTRCYGQKSPRRSMIYLSKVVVFNSRVWNFQMLYPKKPKLLWLFLESRALKRFLNQHIPVFGWSWWLQHENAPLLRAPTWSAHPSWIGCRPPHACASELPGFKMFFLMGIYNAMLMGMDGILLGI